MYNICTSSLFLLLSLHTYLKFVSTAFFQVSYLCSLVYLHNKSKQFPVLFVCLFFNVALSFFLSSMCKIYARDACGFPIDCLI